MTAETENEESRRFEEELKRRLKAYGVELDLLIGKREEVTKRIGDLDQWIRAMGQMLRVEFPDTRISASQGRFDSSVDEPGTEIPNSVAEAVELLIQRGPVNAAGLRRDIREQFPHLDPTLGSVTATLSYNTKHRKYQRISRGQYRLAETSEGGD